MISGQLASLRNIEKGGVFPVAAELSARLSWLIKLRWMAVGGVVCTIEAARLFFSVRLARAPLYSLVAALALYNLALFVVEKRLERTEASEFWRRSNSATRFFIPRPFWGTNLEGEMFRAATFTAVQMMLDLFFLASMLHFSGGIENPFIFFFVFHVIIVSILLSRRATYLIATAAFTFISIVAVGEFSGVLKHYPLSGISAPEIYRSPPWVAAELFVLGMTLYLSAYMCSTIARRLRHREKDIVELSQELSQKAAALETAYEKVSESERLKSQYMRKVAHEIRGPLGTIQTTLNVVLDRLTGELSDKAKDLIGRAESRAAELTTVATDLLILSRAKESRLPTDLSIIRPATIAQSVIEENQRFAERSEQLVSLDLAPDLGEVKVDATGLQQLIGNLLSNAIRYTPRGGKISVRLRKIDVFLRIEVEDTGIGIPEADIPRIFEEFFRSTNAREHSSEGTGLGMAIIKAVVERHNGSISVKSEVGRGTCITVDLPLYGS